MAGQEKHLEECSVANAMGTWFFSVGGALLAIPVGIKRKSLAPLVFFGTTGTMLDIIMGISQCEREHAERQAKLLEAQNAVSERRVMAGQEKHLEECSVANAMGTWFFSVGGALLAIPVGIKRKSLAPLVFFGTTGTMLDIIMGISQCEREHAERQAKLLEAQNAVSEVSFTEGGLES